MEEGNQFCPTRERAYRGKGGLISKRETSRRLNRRTDQDKLRFSSLVKGSGQCGLKRVTSRKPNWQNAEGIEDSVFSQWKEKVDKRKETVGLMGG